MPVLTCQPLIPYCPPQCALCKESIEPWHDAEVDHRVPFSKGGASDDTNAQLVHKECNQRKGARSVLSSSDWDPFTKE